MSIPIIRPRGGYLFATIVVAHIGLISAQVNTSAGIPVLQAAVFAVIAEVQQAASAVVGGMGHVWSGYVALRRVREENAQLRERLDALEVRRQQLEATAQESEQLHQLLRLRDTAEVETRAADVVGGSAAPDSRTVTIDLGINDGVGRDMAVLAPAGVVGRVVQAGPTASKVQLLIDRNAAAGVLVEQTRAQGIVTGVGDGSLSLEFVSATATVTEGDIVRTAGNDGIYPKGFVVGRVARVQKTGGAYVSIVVAPSVDFARLEHVLVVVAPRPARTLVEGPS